VAKTSIKAALNESNGSSIYDPMKHKKHTIAAGTTILECKANECLAVVVSTGSYTSKGKLLREVFSYERHRFKFDEQVPIVIAILLVESLVAFIFIWLIRSDTPVFAWFYGMYVLSTLLPPLLPTVFTVSVGVSDNRLTKKRISCSQSDDILVAGKVSKAFFDKTGTLAADVACFGAHAFILSSIRRYVDESRPGFYRSSVHRIVAIGCAETVQGHGRRHVVLPRAHGLVGRQTNGSFRSTRPCSTPVALDSVQRISLSPKTGRNTKLSSSLTFVMIE
jgi:magnesium-transporting ATPase (P-type)